MATPRHVPQDETPGVERLALHLDLLSAAGEKPKAPPREVRIFQAGMNPSRKGVFICDATSQIMVNAAHKEFSAGIAQPYPFDWAHQMWTYAPTDPVKSGEAAGWHDIAFRNGELWAVECEWTDEASDKILTRKWRFLSPTFRRDEEGRVTAYLGAALTNIPALFNPPMVAADATSQPTETRSMKLFLAALGLPLTLSEEEAAAAIKAKLADSSAALPPEVLSTLGAKSTGEALGMIKGLQENASTGAKALAALAALEKDKATTELETLLDQGVKELEIAPTEREYWKATCLAAKSNDPLKGYLAVAQPKVPGQGQQGSGGGAGGSGGGNNAAALAELSATELEVAKLMCPKSKKLKDFAGEMLAEKRRLGGSMQQQPPPGKK